jgi:hypothetical protein
MSNSRRSFATSSRLMTEKSIKYLPHEPPRHH